MKDYEHLVLWLDYFNSTLSREEGRRVPISRAVKNPTMEELVIAARRLGYSPESVQARHPGRHFITSGYVSIKKKKTKTKTIHEFASLLTAIRGELRQKEERPKQ